MKNITRFRNPHDGPTALGVTQQKNGSAMTHTYTSGKCKTRQSGIKGIRRLTGSSSGTAQLLETRHYGTKKVIKRIVIEAVVARIP